MTSLSDSELLQPNDGRAAGAPDPQLFDIDPQVLYIRRREAELELEREAKEREEQLASIVASHWKSETKNTTRRSSRFSWAWAAVGVVVLAGLLVIPLVWATNQLHQSSSSVVSDLSQFSKFEQGQPASQVAVTRVENAAHKTSSGGTVVWAERSGSVCWGVVVSGGTASAVEQQDPSLCR